MRKKEGKKRSSAPWCGVRDCEIEVESLYARKYKGNSKRPK